MPLSSSFFDRFLWFLRVEVFDDCEQFGVILLPVDLLEFGALQDAASDQHFERMPALYSAVLPWISRTNKARAVISNKVQKAGKEFVIQQTRLIAPDNATARRIVKLNFILEIGDRTAVYPASFNVCTALAVGKTLPDPGRSARRSQPPLRISSWFCQCQASLQFRSKDPRNVERGKQR
jgi:hypothetical protein